MIKVTWGEGISIHSNSSIFSYESCFYNRMYVSPEPRLKNSPKFRGPGKAEGTVCQSGRRKIRKQICHKKQERERSVLRRKSFFLKVSLRTFFRALGYLFSDNTQSWIPMM